MSSRTAITPVDSSKARATNRMQTYYSNAFSAYAIQSQAKNNQYQIEWPQMNVSV
ncbi:hypothetical protein [Sporosarcina sp. P13]|uniref:hypothetical protein n=1 Tax=Sporosarcina sp. P13 TaxID=2048263 RepID=UPI001304740D|nr:hypothetical protein [Sporosarcina sp. P13]